MVMIMSMLMTALIMMQMMVVLMKMTTSMMAVLLIMRTMAETMSLFSHADIELWCVLLTSLL